MAEAHDAVEVIITKRDGGRLTDSMIDWVVDAYTRGAVADEQMSALAMAIAFQGLEPDELQRWTDAMIASGERLDFSGLSRPTSDKHSTGGVRDMITLPLAPLVAACGVAVPQLSGRGLGHTGGTLDKLEAIPGWRADLSTAEMLAQLESVGAVICAAGSGLAPADKKLYALRDVTGTVESIPLISASIMSKKIAEGIDALVLDVKTGSGAFMKTEADSRRLAESLVSIGNASGVKTEAIITAMDAPLGRAVGNALEVIECFEVLKGGGPPDLIEVSVELAARMLVLGKVAGDFAAADAQVRRAIASGAGLERFRQIIEIQGGDPKVVDDYGRMPHVADRHVVVASRAGFVTGLDAELVGRASVALGAGRDRVDDPVDPAVGIMVVAKPGDAVRAGDPVFEMHYRDRARLETAIQLTSRAIAIGDSAPPPRRLIVGEVR